MVEFIKKHLELINEFSKVAWYWVIIFKSIVFLHFSNKQLEIEILEIQFK